MLYIYTGLTIFVLFFRPDFINLTVCIVAFYMLSNTDRIKRVTFRMLVFGIFLSLLYDIFFFILNQQGGDQAYDGGVEKGVRNFSLTMSYISFFFRVSTHCFLTLFADISSISVLERLSRLQPDHQGVER